MRSFSLRHDTVRKLSTNGSTTTDRNNISSSTKKKQHNIITPINTTTSTTTSSDLSYKAIIFMCLLACQFGIQPIVTKKYTSTKIIKSTVILTQEIIKLIIGILGISLSNKTSWSEVSSKWTIKSWLRLALIPATIYLIQNMCSLLAYQNLDAMTYNVLNQTKTLSAAFCCYLFLGKKQSTVQIISLLLLLLAALVMEKIISVDIMLIPYYWITNFGNNTNTSDMIIEDHNMISNLSSPRHFSHGVVPIMCASFLSGLAGALTQKSLQTGQRNALLFTIELCVASILILLVSFVTISDDGRQIRERGFFYEWNMHTMIPILTNSTGGILVGLVIKYAGSVRKGFALIFGILLSGLIQSYTLDTKSLSKEDMAGGLLAAISLWMHATYPYNNNGVKRKEE